MVSVSEALSNHPTMLPVATCETNNQRGEQTETSQPSMRSTESWQISASDLLTIE